MKNKLFFIIIFTYSSIYGQSKRVDTIYVYEKVVIYDTVYIEKKITKSDIEKLKVVFDQTTQTAQIQYPINDTLLSVTLPKNQTKILPKKKNKFLLDFVLFPHIYWGKNTLFSSNALGYGGAFYIQKRFRKLPIAVSLGVALTQFIKTETLTGSNSLFRGYFFIDNQPKLFSEISNNNHTVSLPLELYWTYKNLSPHLGLSYSKSFYRATFIESSNQQVQLFDQTNSYVAQQNAMGLITGIGYRINDKISIDASFEYSKAGSVIFYDHSQPFGKVQTQTSLKGLRFQVVYKL